MGRRPASPSAGTGPADGEGAAAGERSALDPTDPAAFRATAHRLLDACLDRLENARELPWTPPPETLPGLAADAPPAAGIDDDALADELADGIMPFATGNTHPRFFGWVHGTGLANGLLADMVASTANANCGGRRHVGIDVERRVIDWCARLHGLPGSAGGLVTSGTSTATLLALHAARVARFGGDVRAAGQGPGPGSAPTLYAAEGAHQCVVKAIEIMGIGGDALRRLPVDPATGSLSIDALDRAVGDDLAAGRAPFCLVGTAGSVNTGRFDDAHALADAAARHGLWLHVDGAFGAWARIAGAPWEALAGGLERVDSIAFDFHKWPYVQYDAGAVLVRDAETLGDAFSGRAAYLESDDDEPGLAGGAPWPCDLGLELSRGFRALKVWSALRAHGTDALGAAIAGNCRQAALMGELVEAAPELELAAPVTLNVCCFAVVDEGGGDGESADPEAAERVAERHARIAAELQLEGECVLSTTRVAGRSVLRAAIANHRTTEADVRRTVEAVRSKARPR